MHHVRTWLVAGLLAVILALVLADRLTRESEVPGLVLSDQQLKWVGEQIFRNECAGRYDCLVHWNRGEAFPSLGIGHFIWYPAGVDERFVESFPALIRFMADRSVAIPEWLAVEPVPDAPWPDRPAFLQADGSERVTGLRAFLDRTKAVQVAFIFRRTEQSLSRVLDAVPDARRYEVAAHIKALAGTPGGVYALMDYVNFKGEGLSPTERYNDQGWGLLQVLLAMSGSPGQSALVQFREAAGTVLERRAENAENPIERERWLPGWRKRLETYKEPSALKSSE
ncbi:hypothetical protein [Marinobacter sp.]|uniref:hypothetical protein n=1 Tax=Marinobacter sp. TaxID=50741 RepID=UPI0025C2ABE2|nr:hypothetical protein [Marinobacter sp.]